jgi:hypothetical protein
MILNHERDVAMLKFTSLLAIFLFLIMAPEPESKDITEMTKYLVVPDDHAALMASDTKQPKKES